MAAPSPNRLRQGARPRLVAAAQQTRRRHHSLQIGFGQQGFAERLHHHHDVSRLAAETAEVFGQGQGQYAQRLAHITPHRRRPRRAWRLRHAAGR